MMIIEWKGVCEPIYNRPHACRVPTLLVASAADRLLPSMAEAARLAGVLPDARRVTLPDSGHTALLEEGVALAAIMARAGFLPEGHTDAVTAAAAATAAGGRSAPVNDGGAARSADSSRSGGVAASTSANGSTAATAAQPIPDPQRAAATVAIASTTATLDASASSAADRCASSAWQRCAL
jgi:hypothetical protein